MCSQELQTLVHRGGPTIQYYRYLIIKAHNQKSVRLLLLHKLTGEDSLLYLRDDVYGFIKGLGFRKKVTPFRTIFLMIKFFSPPHNNPCVILYKQKGVSFVGCLCVLTHIAHRGALMHGTCEATRTNYSFSRWQTSTLKRFFSFRRIRSSFFRNPIPCRIRLPALLFN
jgi:hypothetical protein